MLFRSEKYWVHLAEDIQYKIRCSLHDPLYCVPTEELKDMLLDKLAVIFTKNGHSITDHNLPLKTVRHTDSCQVDMISDELCQDFENLIQTSEMLCGKLNEGQKNAFSVIVQRVRDGKPGLFFVSGFGGTGKTFLWNAIVSYLRGHKRIVLTVASSDRKSVV